MKRLIIIGAGEFGREVFGWSKQTVEHGRDWTIHGFLDDRPEILAGYRYDAPILSTVERYEPTAGDLFTCSVSEPKSKRHYVEVMLRKGAVFANIVHPTTAFGENVRLGRGVIICPHVTVSADARIGDFVSINGKSGIGHDVQVGDWTSIQSVCDLTGYVKIGQSVTVNSHAVILPKVEIGDGATVGAGSVVVKNVKAGETVFGVPALVLRT